MATTVFGKVKKLLLEERKFQIKNKQAKYFEKPTEGPMEKILYLYECVLFLLFKKIEMRKRCGPIG